MSLENLLLPSRRQERAQLILAECRRWTGQSEFCIHQHTQNWTNWGSGARLLCPPFLFPNFPNPSLSLPFAPSLKPQIFFAKTNPLVNWSIWLSPWFSIPFQSLEDVLCEPGVAVADDVYPGTKHNAASVSSLYLLEKMVNKTNPFCQYILGLKCPGFASKSVLFHHWSQR